MQECRKEESWEMDLGRLEVAGSRVWEILKFEWGRWDGSWGGWI
jgi:hypothetical protein